MLYRQITSERSALHREKELLTEKLAKKTQKLALNRQELEETTNKFEKVRDENQQYGAIITQVMGALKSKDSASTNPSQVNEMRQSLARLSQNPMNNNSNFGGGLNVSAMANRNSNIKKVIRGGNGSIYQKSRTSIANNLMGSLPQQEMRMSIGP